jgi:hypothetical protein
MLENARKRFEERLIGRARSYKIPEEAKWVTF